jgi:hypothetical protein
LSRRQRTRYRETIPRALLATRAFLVAALHVEWGDRNIVRQIEALLRRPGTDEQAVKEKIAELGGG